MRRFEYLSPAQREKLFRMNREMGDFCARRLGFTDLEEAHRGGWDVTYNWQEGSVEAAKVKPKAEKPE